MKIKYSFLVLFTSLFILTTKTFALNQTDTNNYTYSLTDNLSDINHCFDDDKITYCHSKGSLIIKFNKTVNITDFDYIPFSQQYAYVYKVIVNDKYKVNLYSSNDIYGVNQLEIISYDKYLMLREIYFDYEVVGDV